jgi:hypothetical protein
MLLVGLKRLLAAWKAARKRGKMKMKKMNLSGEPKETAVSRKIMPADGSKPASAMNGDLGTPPLTPSDQSTAYLSPTGVAKSKDCCPLTAAAAGFLQRSREQRPQDQTREIR